MSTPFSQTSRAEMALHLVKIELEGEIVQSQSWYFSPQAGESLDNIYSILEKKTQTTHLKFCLQLWFCQSIHWQLFSSPWELLTKYKPYLTQESGATFSLGSFKPPQPWANHLSWGRGEQAKINYAICNFNCPFTVSSIRGLLKQSLFQVRKSFALWSLSLRLRSPIEQALAFPLSPPLVHPCIPLPTPIPSFSLQSLTPARCACPLFPTSRQTLGCDGLSPSRSAPRGRQWKFSPPANLLLQSSRWGAESTRGLFSS